MMLIERVLLLAFRKKNIARIAFCSLYKRTLVRFPVEVHPLSVVRMWLYSVSLTFVSAARLFVNAAALHDSSSSAPHPSMH